MMEDNDKDSLQVNEIDELIEKRVEEDINITRISVTIGLFILIIGFHIHSIYKTISDKTIAVFACPSEFNNDGVVKLTPLSKLDYTKLDTHIKSFVLKYANALHPRYEEDVEPYTKFIFDHSTGSIRKEYEARLDDSEEIKTQVRNGTYSKFYMKPLSYTKIRKIDNTINDRDEWVVEIPGFLHKKSEMSVIKSQPTLRLNVILGDRTTDNPEGLYVISKVLERIKDPISGNKEVEK